MGGLGSGRQGWKATTGSFNRLNINRLHRDKLLVPGLRYNWQWSINGKRTDDINIIVEEYCLTLDYRTRSNGGAWEDKQYRVPLSWTDCHLGGQRPWFLCPCCGRRVAVLWGGGIFACRHCHKLAYASQREDRMSRALRRMQKIQARMGWDGSYGPKPKGMHWRTFERLEQQHDQFNEASWAAMAAKFGRY
jgi:hypothetical protein